MLKTFYNSKQSTGGGSNQSGGQHMGQTPYSNGGNQNNGATSNGTKRAI
jgi:hypothetical protein